MRRASLVRLRHRQEMGRAVRAAVDGHDVTRRPRLQPPAPVTEAHAQRYGRPVHVDQLVAEAHHDRPALSPCSRPPANATQALVARERLPPPPLAREAVRVRGPVLLRVRARAAQVEPPVAQPSRCPRSSASSTCGCQYWPRPGTTCPSPTPPSARRGQSWRAADRPPAARPAPGRRRGRPRRRAGRRPRWTARRLGSASACSTTAVRTNPPGCAARPTVAQSPRRGRGSRP